MRKRPVRWSAATAVTVSMALISVSACGINARKSADSAAPAASASTQASPSESPTAEPPTAEPPTAEPPTASASAALSANDSSKAPPATNKSIPKAKVCDDANTAFNDLFGALLDAAQPALPGEKATIPPQKLAVLRTKLRAIVATLRGLSANSADPALRQPLAELADAAAGYLTVDDLSTTDKQGAALKAATAKVGALCKPPTG